MTPLVPPQAAKESRHYFSMGALVVSLFISILGGIVGNMLWPPLSRFTASVFSHESSLSVVFDVKANYLREILPPMPYIPRSIPVADPLQPEIKTLLTEKLLPRGYTNEGLATILKERSVVFDEIQAYIDSQRKQHLETLLGVENRLHVLSSCYAIFIKLANTSKDERIVKEIDITIPSKFGGPHDQSAADLKSYVTFFPDDIFSKNHNAFKVTPIPRVQAINPEIDGYAIEWEKGLAIPGNTGITCIFAVPHSHALGRSLSDIESGKHSIHATIRKKAYVVLAAEGGTQRINFTPAEKDGVDDDFHWPRAIGFVIGLYLLILLGYARFRRRIVQDAGRIDPEILRYMMEHYAQESGREPQQPAGRK